MCSNFSGPQDPPIHVVKLTLSGRLPPIHVVKPTLYGLLPPIRVAFPTLSRSCLSNMGQQAPQMVTTWHLYRPTRPGMIQNGLSDSPTWPHIVLRPTALDNPVMPRRPGALKREMRRCHSLLPHNELSEPYVDQGTETTNVRSRCNSKAIWPVITSCQ
jgi:hypothetical protein